MVAGYLKPENLVVGLFGLLVTIAGFDAERMISAQKETNDKLASLSQQVADMKVVQAELTGRVTANEDRITTNRIYITNLDNRVRDLERGSGRKTNYVMPKDDSLPPVRRIDFVDRSADRARPVAIKWP